MSRADGSGPALRRLVAAAVGLGLLVPATPAVASYAGGEAPRTHVGSRPAVIAKRVIGRSVQGRPIVAWHLGEPGRPTVLLIASMHGNEATPRHILTTLRDGEPVNGINLWVVPVYNPDGVAAGTRRNARGVDLNRNYPYRWTDLDGNYESGPHAASEPETRAMMRFQRRIRPQWVLSFHQPLHGVDTDTKRPRFARRVARALDLPRKSFTCGGVCRGTMTGWFNHRFRGAALTVEYGAHPSRRLMRVRAPRQVLSIWDAWRGGPGFEQVG